jgi:hypothetical protein
MHVSRALHVFVTTGLDPVVHVASPSALRRRMDCRIKSGNDEAGISLHRLDAPPQQFSFR